MTAESSTPTWWTYQLESDTKPYDAEFKTKAEAQLSADERWAADVQENESDLRNGEVFTTTATFFEMRDTDDGPAVVSKSCETVDFEYYHGDFAEHNTYF